MTKTVAWAFALTVKLEICTRLIILPLQAAMSYLPPNGGVAPSGGAHHGHGEPPAPTPPPQSRPTGGPPGPPPPRKSRHDDEEQGKLFVGGLSWDTTQGRDPPMSSQQMPLEIRSPIDQLSRCVA